MAPVRILLVEDNTSIIKGLKYSYARRPKIAV